MSKIQVIWTALACVVFVSAACVVWVVKAVPEAIREWKQEPAKVYTPECQAVADLCEQGVMLEPGVGSVSSAWRRVRVSDE